MKQAKATVKEAEALLRWLQKQENADRQPPPYSRTIFGYLLMLEHCADPAKDYIDFRPGTSPDEIAALKQRAEAAEARVAEQRKLIDNIEAKNASQRGRLRQLESLQRENNSSAWQGRIKAEARVKELEEQLKGTMQAGGYEHFTAKVCNANQQAHNAMYVAQQLEKKVAELEAQNARLRAALERAFADNMNEGSTLAELADRLRKETP